MSLTVAKLMLIPRCLEICTGDLTINGTRTPPSEAADFQ